MLLYAAQDTNYDRKEFYRLYPPTSWPRPNFPTLIPGGVRMYPPISPPRPLTPEAAATTSAAAMGVTPKETHPEAMPSKTNRHARGINLFLEDSNMALSL